jgi:diaminopimelate decarboxylase
MRKVIKNIDGKNIFLLVKKFGTPIFIFSEKELLNSYKRFKSLFSYYYPKIIIAYSYKTNYTPYICKCLKKLGAWAEVTSLFELKIAEKVGYSSKIIFNGPCKTKEELTEAMKLDSIINVDSVSELNEIINLGKKHKLTPKIGLRVKIRKGSKFGLNKEEVTSALSLIGKTEQALYVGLHAHLGTQISDPLLYKREIRYMVGILKLIKELGFSTNFLDIGGGFPLQHKNKKNTLKVLARTIGTTLKRECLKRNLSFPTLILEPGRALVGSSHYLVTKVVRLKNSKRRTQTVIVDAGLNVVPEVEEYEYEIFPTNFSLPLKKYYVGGPLCMEEDILRKCVTLPSLKEGDLLVIPNVGAYSISLSWQFIKLRPPIIAITTKKKIRVIRRKEMLSDVLKYF